MSYQALYRVWRPQTFEDISGQDVITQTLKNAIKNGNTSHAYLFTGPRGTGKTSAAKIFAKAINCPYSEDGEPCNECQICEEITKGSLGDVIEIDAASNNGVEEIRDIREKANYAPTSAVYKVYIIDEVHMLSASAFNALLKTLEEPPTNVIFILATTEPHKIPATIISRTQRFDFRRIDTQSIIDRLTHILNYHEVDFEEDVVLIIANAAEGGMRDALSMLDQALSFMTDKLTEDVALQITGSITQDLLLDYIKAISHRQTEKALVLLQSIIAQGKDPGRFIEDAIMMTRDILLYQSSNAESFITKLAKVDDTFTQLANELDRETAYHMIDVLNTTQQELRMSNHAEVYLEVATVKLTHQSSVRESIEAPQQEAVVSDEVNQLKRQLEQLQNAVKSMDIHQPSQPVQAKKPARRVPSGQSFKVNLRSIERVLKHATRSNLDELQELWPDLIAVLSTKHSAILNNSQPVAASPDGLVVTFVADFLCEKAEYDEELQDAIGNYIEKVVGYRPRLVTVPENDWPKIRSDYIQKMKREDGSSSTPNSSEQPSEQSHEELTESNEAVQAAVDIFGKENVKIKE
ncbi:MAG TPA: DNA polymerase III subunit gamma/tau [Alloiococcus sp.]|nr:DNA polymerase III subunit gamma/tau [Alloiococcus sp.]